MGESFMDASPERATSGCSSAHSSPEFEFWMPRNPSSFPEPDQLPTADKLFVDGVLLPLHLRRRDHGSPLPVLVDECSASISSTCGGVATPSRRWKDILFKKTVAPTTEKTEKKMKRKEKKTAPGAELNINIWPFSRSRSAGNGPKPYLPGPARKVSSAPCSRSNSGGESKARKLARSPGRVSGVHLGRSSPVWQVRRPAKINANSGDGKPKPKAKILNLTAPMCIGYRSQVTCREEQTSTGGNTYPATTVDIGISSILSLRTIFSRKVH